MNSPRSYSRLDWFGSTLALGMAGGVVLWAALPPLSWSWLAWIAPVPWLLLVRRESLPGRRPYSALWLAGFAFWLAALYWLTLPHPATSLGWLALSAYLAFYLPVFVGLSRVAVHRLSVPLWLAAPLVWTGLELARAHVLTGFLMASLAHTQVRSPPLIQISDLVGEYGVSFIVVMVAAAVACAVFPPRRLGALAPTALAIGATLVYGAWRLGDAQSAQSEPPPTTRLALIQGNSLAEWKYDPSRERQIMEEYTALSDRAVALAADDGDGRPLDLVVWPETMFRGGLVSFDDDFELPAGALHTKDQIADYRQQQLADLAARLGTAALVGVDRIHYPAAAPPGDDPLPRVYNSAALVSRDGTLIGTYDKIHRVMFGEYIPFADRLPFLYGLTPLTGGIDAGAAPAALELDGVRLAPNICYETVLPHVIRRQVVALDKRGQSPDVLVNLTNDAWYWGSSELDMHLACGVFRAVEMRRPLVIAANGGISAWIDHLGRIRAESPRMTPDIIIADVELARLDSPYLRYGDWFAGACLLGCFALAAFSFSRVACDARRKRVD